MMQRVSSVFEAFSPRRSKDTRENNQISSQQQPFDDVEEASDLSKRRLVDNPRYGSTSTLDEIIIQTASPPQTHRRLIEEAPRSLLGLPLDITTPDHPRLIHPFLNKISLHVRFGINGLLSNFMFMIAYNAAIHSLQTIPAPTIYSTVYLIFIPVQHVMSSLLVFGWPDRYVPSLMSNLPIGLTAIALGSAMTAYLDKYQFNEQIEDWIRNNFTFSHMPARTAAEKSEFYSSLLVLFATSLWTYILSLCINSPAAMSDKKEL